MSELMHTLSDRYLLKVDKNQFEKFFFSFSLKFKNSKIPRTKCVFKEFPVKFEDIHTNCYPTKIRTHLKKKKMEQIEAFRLSSGR